MMGKKIRKAQVWIGFQKKAQDPQVLLFQVIGERGGGWHPVTGGVDEGESFLKGAKREVYEETGIKAKKGEWIDLELEYEFEGRFGPVVEKAFGFVLHHKKENPKIDESEHVLFEWVSVPEALRRLSHGPQRDALKRFLCYLDPNENASSF